MTSTKKPHYLTSLAWQAWLVGWQHWLGACVLAPLVFGRPKVLRTQRESAAQPADIADNRPDCVIGLGSFCFGMHEDASNVHYGVHYPRYPSPFPLLPSVAQPFAAIRPQSGGGTATHPFSVPAAHLPTLVRYLNWSCIYAVRSLCRPFSVLHWRRRLSATKDCGVFFLHWCVL